MKPPFRNQKPRVHTSLPGPKSLEAYSLEQRWIAPGLQQLCEKTKLAICDGRGNTLVDADGNHFLDWTSAMGVCSLGHRHPAFTARLKKALESPLSGSFTSHTRVAYLRAFSRYFPEPDRYCVQFYSSGTEAVESALRLARSFTKRREVVAFWGAFHGKTHASASLSFGTSSTGAFRRFSLAGAEMPGVSYVPYPDCYRCPFGRTYPSCKLACVDFLEKHIASALQDRPAALLVEPIQGTSGNRIPPPEFLPAVARIARKHGALLLCDEMITGFGRTGHFWASSRARVTPDILMCGKAMGNGIPISAVLLHHRLKKALPWSGSSQSSSSYGGNPFSLAAALTVLEVMEREQLLNNVKTLGPVLEKELQPFEEFSFVGMAETCGLMARIELVTNNTRDPLPKAQCQKLFQACLQEGVIALSYTPHMRVYLPLNTDSATLKNGVKALYRGFVAFEGAHTRRRSQTNHLYSQPQVSISS